MTGWDMGPEAWIWMGAWALVMVLVVWSLVRGPRRDDRDDPDAILRARFARGEISEEEYRRAEAALEAHPAAPWHGNSHGPRSASETFPAGSDRTWLDRLLRRS